VTRAVSLLHCFLFSSVNSDSFIVTHMTNHSVKKLAISRRDTAPPVIIPQNLSPIAAITVVFWANVVPLP